MFGNKMQAMWHLLSTGFYTGYLPWIPGTWASLVATLLFFFLPEWSLLVQVIISALLFGAGLLSIDRVQQQTEQHDPSWIVIDEWWGMSVALLGVPKIIGAYIVAYLLFRFFDIIKITPINHLERLPGSWGVILDDGAAGMLALLGTHIFCTFCR